MGMAKVSWCSPRRENSLTVTVKQKYFLVMVTGTKTGLCVFPSSGYVSPLVPDATFYLVNLEGGSYAFYARNYFPRIKNVAHPPKLTK